MPDLPNREEYYGLIRHQMEHEENILNQRVIWFVFAQSFLFVAYASVLNAPERSTELLGSMQQLLFWILPISALAASLFTAVSIVTSLLTKTGLRRRYESFRKPGDEGEGREVSYPPIEGLPSLRGLTRVSTLGLALVFIVTWLIVLVRQVAG